jgi:putative transcriptional regulator
MLIIETSYSFPIVKDWGESMSVSYKKLWKLIIDKDLKKSDVRKSAKISASTFSKMSKNDYVALEVIERICNVLECDIGDIVEIVKDKNSIERG